MITGVTEHDIDFAESPSFWNVRPRANLREKLFDQPKRDSERKLFLGNISFEHDHSWQSEMHALDLRPNYDDLGRSITATFRGHVLVGRKARHQRSKKRVMIADASIYEAARQLQSGASIAWRKALGFEPTVKSLIDEVYARGQEDIADRLAELQRLVINEPDNDPIDVLSLENAAKILEHHSFDMRPSIVVGFDGRISVEWEEEVFGFALVTIFLTNGRIWYEYGDEQHEDAYTISVADALDRFAPLINPG